MIIGVSKAACSPFRGRGERRQDKKGKERTWKKKNKIIEINDQKVAD